MGKFSGNGMHTEGHVARTRPTMASMSPEAQSTRQRDEMLIASAWQRDPSVKARVFEIKKMYRGYARHVLQHMEMEGLLKSQPYPTNTHDLQAITHNVRRSSSK